MFNTLQKTQYDSLTRRNNKRNCSCANKHEWHFAIKVCLVLESLHTDIIKIVVIFNQENFKVTEGFLNLVSLEIK